MVVMAAALRSLRALPRSMSRIKQARTRTRTPIGPLCRRRACACARARARSACRRIVVLASSSSSSSQSSPPSQSAAVGVHALVFSGSWSRDDALKAIAGAAKANYDFVEIPLLSPEAVDGPMTKDLLEEHGIFATASLGLADDADISSEDNDVARRGEELLNAAVDTCASFGGKVLCGVTYSSLRKYDKPLTAKGRDNCVQALKNVAKRCSDNGMTLGLEVVNRYETNVCNTARDAATLCDDVGASNVFVHLDSYHMNIEEDSMEQAVLDAGDKLGYVHIGEAHRGYLGQGQCDLDGLFASLKKSKYSGYVAFESFSRAVVSDDLSNTLCVWRDMWEDSEDLAVSAREYIRDRFV